MESLANYQVWHKGRKPMSADQTARSFAEETRIFDRSVDSTNFLLDFWWLWALTILIVMVVFYIQGKHKLLGQLDERCDAAFADIDAILAERHALIPNLVETVKAFAGQEHKVLKDVIDARARATSTTGGARFDAEAAVGSSLANLWSISESYPDLASSQHFRELRSEMSRIEEKITASRKFYNLSVEERNGVSRAFPGSLIARHAKLGDYEKFTLGEQRAALAEPVRANFG
jgi:LemA protein